MREHIIINNDRTVTVPTSVTKIGNRFEHNVNRVTFDCPRYADDEQTIDLSAMKIYINYIRPDKKPLSSLAENVTVDEADPTIIHFDFRITRTVTMVDGVLDCLVCIKITNSEGVEEYHWNSDIFSKLSVGKGMENEETIAEENIDLITQLLVNLDTTNAEVSDVSERIDGVYGKVGELETLATEDKSSVVAAVNEVKESSDELKGDLIDFKYKVLTEEESELINNEYDNTYSHLSTVYGWVIQKIIPKYSDVMLSVYVPVAGNVHFGTLNVSTGVVDNYKMLNLPIGWQTIDLSDFQINADSYLILKSMNNGIAYKADSNGVVTKRIDIFTSETKGTTPTLIDVASPFLWCIKLSVVTLEKNKFSNTVIVDKNGGFDYTTIQEAIDGTNDGDTILIMPSVYEEQIKMWGKNRNLVGLDKEKCIIVSKSRLYNNEPLQANIGCISNLTLIAGYGLTPIDKDTVSTSYALHVEYANATSFELVIENCNIISNVAPAIGLGVRYNQKVTIKNCYLETKAKEMYSSVYSNYFNCGAIFCHNDASGSNLGTGGYISIENCELKGVSTAITLQSQNNGNTLTHRFLKNILWSTENGTENAITLRTEATSGHLVGSDGVLDSISFGNNVTELNV